MTDLNRRDFNRLTAAALGGLLAGAAAGCGDSAPPQPGAGTPTVGPANGAAAGEAGPANFLLAADHACRGLNLCMGQGKGGDNACAGQGDCATIDAHSCSGQNECKGQGGCGAAPAQNACKEQGGCAIPLHAGAWEKARAAFESKMQEEQPEKTVGAAPAAAE